MSSKRSLSDTAVAAGDDFVPDRLVAREFGCTKMTLWRWDHDDALIALGWPPPIKIRERNFRSRTMLNKFKEAMLLQAIAARASSRASAKASSATGEVA
jgi:hypothetical protein